MLAVDVWRGWAAYQEVGLLYPQDPPCLRAVFTQEEVPAASIATFAQVKRGAPAHVQLWQ